jgi:putative ATPase
MAKIAYNKITVEILQSINQKTLRGVNDKSMHYDLISAFIKSIRGSDENASIYYLARLIVAGEDPRFIARRLLIFASEDIGNANPNALNIANSTYQAVKEIGMPESRIILSQAVIYLANSPKSNSAYKAINTAIEAINRGEMQDIPNYLRDCHYSGAESLGVKGYQYPHDFGGWVKQKYLTKELIFVENNEIGFEKTLKEWSRKIKN